MTSASRHVWVVDDDESVRVALRRLLTSAGFNVTAFPSATAFIEQSAEGTPACLVLDQRMPDVSGLELQRTINRRDSATSIIFITGHADVRASVEAMKAGAVDFLMKPVEEDALIDAVTRALGRSAHLLDTHRERDTFLQRCARLTPRERDVARLVLHGLLNKQIAGQLGIAEKTVKVHRGRLMQKLAVTSVAELVRLAERTHAFGVVPPLGSSLES
jgi:FixJ family two-component response regulator